MQPVLPRTTVLGPAAFAINFMICADSQPWQVRWQESGDGLAKVSLEAEALMATHIVNQIQKFASDKSFCGLAPAITDALEREAITTTYPTGAVLFAEGQAPRGVFIVRRGRGKLSIRSEERRGGKECRS